MTRAIYTKLVVLFVLCRLSAFRVAAQEPTAAAIPDSLRQGASVVERTDETAITIESPSKARIHRKYIYTILNAAGDEYATIHTWYDRFHELENVTGILYDAGGKVLKKIRKADMEDWSTAGSGILMTDSRVKLYHFSSLSYPYSVSFEEEVVLSGLFVLPGWRPQPSPGMAVESSSLVVRAPAGFPLRYRQYDYPQDPQIGERGGSRVYTWELHGRPAEKEEPMAPAWSRTEPCVLLAPGDFEENGYKGQLYTWAGMGKFVEQLYRGRDKLPDGARTQVHRLVDGLRDDRAKIDTLYRYLQRSTHYVGIELGIGGWQPFDAAYVYDNKYGDCKALSNYMVALLKEAGIRACDVLIRAGEAAQPMDTGFVCSQFNHAIVVAFAGRDSVWLECTSPVLPPGYLGSFTGDRDALMLDEDGGHIVHTPVYGIHENFFSRVVRGSIDLNGNLQATLQSEYSGLEQDALESEVDRLSGKELTEQRQQALGVSNAVISGLREQETPGPVPVIGESLRLEADSWCNVAGNRLFLSPGPFLKQVQNIQGEGQMRTSGLELTRSYQETDSILLQIPVGYAPEGALPSANYSAAFGSYRIHGRMSGDTLLLVCRYRQNKGLYKAENWPKMVHFFNLIHREAEQEIVFIKP